LIVRATNFSSGKLVSFARDIARSTGFSEPRPVARSEDPSPDSLEDERATLSPAGRGSGAHAGVGAAAVVGSMSALTSEMRSAGKPPRLACSRIWSAFSAM